MDKLITKRRELESEELVKTFEKSKKSLKEIIEFMNGNADGEIRRRFLFQHYWL